MSSPKGNKLTHACAVVLDLSMKREVVSHADLGTDSGFSFDSLNVNFDLALDDWDDFSDDNSVKDSSHRGRNSDQSSGAWFLLVWINVSVKYHNQKD